MPTGKVITRLAINMLAIMSASASQPLYKLNPRLFNSPISLLSDKVKFFLLACKLLISNLYQPVLNSDNLMVLVQSNSIASSQPAGTSSGVTMVTVSVVKLNLPVDNTRIYAVSTPDNLSPYCSKAPLTTTAGMVSTRL